MEQTVAYNKYQDVWKIIAGYDGFYEVSNNGQVRSLGRIDCRGHKLKEKALKLILDPSGYYKVGLYKNRVKKNYLVHRLVAEAFISNPNNKIPVNHIDGNKINNLVENLEWTTHSENTKHAYDTNLKTGLKGENNGRAKLTEKEVIEIYFRAHKGENQQRLAAEFGVSCTNITSIKLGKLWSQVTKHLKENI